MPNSSKARPLTAGLPVAAIVAIVVALGGAIAFGADSWFVASLIGITAATALGFLWRPGSVVLLSIAGLYSVVLGFISLFSVGIPLIMGGTLLLVGRRSRVV
jgi:hypothetical protein